MIVPMKKALLVCLREDREKLLVSLQQCGELMPIAEPEAGRDENAEGTASVSSSPSASPHPADAEALFRETDALLRRIRPYRKKAGFFDGPPTVDYDAFQKENPEAKTLAVSMEETLEALGNAKAKLAALESDRAQLLPWLPLTEPVETIRNGRYSAVFTGLLPAVSAEDAKTAVEEAGGALELLDGSRDGMTVITACPLNREEEIRAALRAFDFSESRPPLENGRPADAYEALGRKTAETEETIAALEARLKELSARAEELEVLNDQARAAGDRESAPVNETAETVYLRGWVRSDRTDRVEAAVRRVTDCYALQFTDPLPEEKPPTVVKNNRFVRPFETITDMFSRPDPHGIDPNPVLAPWYWIIFGLMMGDVGYGALMAVLLFAFKKLKKPRGGGGKLVDVMLYSSITTILAGILYGSYFGETWRPILPQQQEPIKVLIFTLVVGVLHIFSGMILKMVMDIRRGRFWDAIFDQLSWMVLITGLGMLFLPALKTVGMVMAAVGAVTILLTAGRSSKNIFGKVAGGLTGLYNITSYLSDILSYSRIFALSLATGVVGYVMNLLAGMVREAFPGALVVIGFLLSVVVYIIGHGFNLAMGLLSAYVHDSRLQYIEFFNKFYEGDGDPFQPLALSPRHVELTGEAPDSVDQRAANPK